MSTSCSRRSTAIAIGVLIAIAAVLRLWDLELRPPHHDESVNGWFTEKLVGEGYYVYDPANYHGPIYFYLLAVARELLGFGLWQLRLPGALIGIALCFVPLLVRRRVGWPAALAACAVLATSPTLIYYARYAIHETLLAGLGLLAAACMLRWADRGCAGWLVGTGACIAGMVATKETTILFLAPAGLWLVGESVIESRRERGLVVLGNRWVWSRQTLLIAAALVGVIAAIHVLSFTAALRQPGQLADQLHRSIEAYARWGHTGTDPGAHVKPFYYYLQLATRYELVMCVLAAVGMVDGFRDRAIRATGVVGLVMLAVYSAIPYKVPWLPMSWLALLAIPAGHGALVAVRVIRDGICARAPTAVAIGALLIPALAISVRSSFVRPADPREALAYVHTDADYNRWFPYVREAAAIASPRDVAIGVDSDVEWPLAWSLLPYHTRWRAHGDEHVIIASRSRAAAVERRLTERYYRAEYQIRDSAEPIVLYLRHRTFESRLPADRRLAVVGTSRTREVR